MHLMWGQHIAFGRPFLEEGVVIDAPAQRLIVQGEWPNYQPRRFQPEATGDWPYIAAPDGEVVDASKVPGYGTVQAQEMAYLAELIQGWYAITNPVREIGFGLSFDPSLYQYIWYWQQLGDVAKGYPWWGRTHTQALEPWTSYPSDGLTKAIENGTALLLEPGEQIETWLCAVAYEGVKRVAGITANGDLKELNSS
jgi:hypothetical protein